MSAKKRVRFAEAPDMVREFEVEHKKVKKELDPMEQLEGAVGAVCIYEGGASVDPASAAAQRARQRKDNLMARFEDGAAFLGSIESVEALYDEPEERFNEVGIPIEPFHLKREREEGYFDETGTYVEYKTDDVEDNWADSLADVEIDEGWLARVRASQAAAQQGGGEEPVHDLDPEELRAYKQRLSNLLQPGETTLQALRRLGRQRVGSPEGGSGGGPGEGGGERAGPVKLQHAMPSPVREAFDRLTEYSSTLMEHGEYGIHSQTREQILRSLLAGQEDEGAPVAGAAAMRPLGAEGAEGGSPAGGAAAAAPRALQGVRRQGGGSLGGGPAAGAATAAARTPLGELEAAGVDADADADAGAALARRLLAGAAGGEEGGEGGGEGRGADGGREEGEGVQRMSTDHELPAVQAVARAGAAGGGLAGGGAQEELDIFADEDEADPGPSAAAAAAVASDAGARALRSEPGGDVREAGAAAGSGDVPVAGGDAGVDVDMHSVDAENAAPEEQSTGSRAQAGEPQAAGGSGGSGLAGPGTPALPAQQGKQGQQGETQLDGFEFDPASGYWYNTELGCFYDAANQLYGDAASGQWYRYSGGQYQPA